MIKTLKQKIIDTLIKSQAISAKDLAEAQVLHKEKGIPLDRALIEKGLIKEQDVLVLLVRELKIPFINLSKYKIDSSLKEIVPERIAREYNIIPLALLEKTLTIALADPLNIFAIDNIKNLTGLDIDIVMSTQADILKALDVYYGAAGMTSITELSKEIDTQGFEIVTESEQSTNVEEAVDESEKAPIIRMINLVIKKAIQERASDIHMEPMIDCVRVRYRIDGVLRDILDIPKENQNAVIVRIKIMSRLNITINQIPQDGRFKLKFKNKEVDFRVSILPTTFGQKIVMRILDKANLSVGLEGLGISPKSFEVISEAIRKPFGMILITGPTGSGKSTTLYSIVNSLNHPDKHIITVEDPVEYLIDGLAQIQARPEIGLTFAEGLRAILRQSPDIVMVGEIRDQETADIAIKASLTGQLVLSTLHTNDAAGAVTRLVDMGVEAFLVASSLILVTAQRLCRKICPHCKEPIEIAKDVLNRLHYPMKANTIFYQGKGCERCHQTGYLGRSCVTEALKIDDKVRELLLEGKSSDQIKQYAKKFQGMNTLFDDAMQKCLAGTTTLEEVLRVTTME